MRTRRKEKTAQDGCLRHIDDNSLVSHPALSFTVTAPQIGRGRIDETVEFQTDAVYFW